MDLFLPLVHIPNTLMRNFDFPESLVIRLQIQAPKSSFHLTLTS